VGGGNARQEPSNKRMCQEKLRKEELIKLGFRKKRAEFGTKEKISRTSRASKSAGWFIYIDFAKKVV